jgi:hypothetical protein
MVSGVVTDDERSELALDTISECGSSPVGGMASRW